MTSILTFTVTSLRVSSDMPIQADYLPLITIYFMMSIFYTLIGFAWYVVQFDYFISIWCNKIIRYKYFF